MVIAEFKDCTKQPVWSDSSRSLIALTCTCTVVSKGFENILLILNTLRVVFLSCLKQDAKQKVSEEKRKPLVEQMEEKKKEVEKKKEMDKEQVVVGGKLSVHYIIGEVAFHMIHVPCLS